MNSRIYMLIRLFDKEEHTDALIQKGELYWRVLEYFKKHVEERRSHTY